jgi:hypothetical protein
MKNQQQQEPAFATPPNPFSSVMDAWKREATHNMEQSVTLMNRMCGESEKAVVEANKLALAQMKYGQEAMRSWMDGLRTMMR